MKKRLLFIALCSAIGLSYAQHLPEIIPPTPTVANLMQFEEVPINHYSGQPNISIPLYSKTINADLGINVGLSYNTQGVKINNRSGWTGTSWSLHAGGVISRTVRGVPDERKRNTGIVIGEGILHNDDFWNYSNFAPGSEEQQEFLWRAGGTSRDKYDYQFDLFQFNFLGVSGRFILIKEDGLVIPKLLSKNSNIRIDVDYNTNASSHDYLALNSFTITDTKGYIYTFDVKEIVHSEPFIAVERFDHEQSYQGNGQQYVTTNAWYLSKIEMPNSTSETPLVLATFDYQNSVESFTASISKTDSRPINYSTSLWNDLMAVSYNASIVKPKKSYAYLSTTSVTKKLSKITFTRDGTYIDFNLSNSIEHPETNGDVLEYIRIKDAENVENKHFRLVYDNNLTNRLWLNEVHEVAGSLHKKYTLNYNDRHGLRAFNGGSDSWGYNSGSLNPTTTCGISLPDPEAIQKGLLSKITYPTGGTKEFVFEEHKITYQGNTQLTDDQYRDMNPDNWIPKTLDLNFNSATDNSSQYNNVVPRFLSIDQKQGLVYRKMNTTASQEEQFNAFIEITGPNNYRNVFRLDEDEVAFTLEAGRYAVRFHTLTVGTNYTYTGCIGYKNFKPNVMRYVYGGGVRIKNIMFRNTPDSDQAEKDIYFNYDDAGGQNRSSGAIDGLISGLSKSHQETVTRHFLPSACAYPGSTILHSFRFQVTTNGINVELTQGQYVGYKTVDVLELNNGFTRHTYTSAQDYFNPSSTFTYPYAPAQDIDYKRGLLLKKEVFDNSNRLLLETNNSYDFEEETVAKMYNHYSQDCRWKPYYDFYHTYRRVSNNLQNHPDAPLNQCYLGTVSSTSLVEEHLNTLYPDNWTKNPVQIIGYRVVRSGTTLPCENDCLSNLYATCNPNSNNVPFYFISNPIKRTWARLTQTEQKEYYYDDDNAISISENKQTFLYNMLNHQVSQKDAYYQVKGADQHVQTKYYYPQGTHLNSNSIEIKSALIAANKVNEVLETQVFKNGTKLNETYTVYGNFSNLLLPKEIHAGKGNNTPEKEVEYVNYDEYGNLLEVKKTDGISISYIYGFNRSVPVAKIENASYNAIEAILGNNFNLAGNLSSSQLSALKHELPGAMISSFTYNPLVGVTSITDSRGNVIYYEYDAFNRLKLVKDKEGNIVSENQYHYKN